MNIDEYVGVPYYIINHYYFKWIDIKKFNNKSTESIIIIYSIILVYPNNTFLTISFNSKAFLESS